jgi:hypothetical protein
MLIAARRGWPIRTGVQTPRERSSPLAGVIGADAAGVSALKVQSRLKI